MISGTWKRSLLDVRVKRGADVGGDYHFVTAFIKLKQVQTAQRFNTEKLRNPGVVESAFVL